MEEKKGHQDYATKQSGQELELELMRYKAGTAQNYSVACFIARQEMNKVLTALRGGRRYYCVGTRFEGNEEEGVLIGIYAPTSVDLGACLRRECDPSQPLHYVNEYLRPSHEGEKPTIIILG